MIILTCDYTDIAIPEECVNINLLHRIKHVKSCSNQSLKYYIKESSKVSFQFLDGNEVGKLPSEAEEE